MLSYADLKTYTRNLTTAIVVHTPFGRERPRAISKTDCLSNVPTSGGNPRCVLRPRDYPG